MNILNLSEKNNNLFSLIMLISILGYFMFKTSYRYLGDVFQTLLYLGTLGTLYLHKLSILKCRVIQLFLLSIILQIISWYNLHQLDPTYPNKLSLTWLGYLFIFFSISIWLKGHRDKINSTMFAFIIGTILTCLLHSKNIYADYIKIISGLRTDYHFMNANHSAALLATSLVLIMYMISTWTKNIKYMALLLSIAAIVIFLLMGTQSRSAYVALIIPFLILIYFSLKNSKISFISSIFLTLLLVGSSFYSSIPRLSSEAEVFQKRYETNQENKKQIQDNTIINKASKDKELKSSTTEKAGTSSIINNFDTLGEKEKLDTQVVKEKTTLTLDNLDKNIPYTSIGLRFHFWIDTIRQSISNPMFGLGNNANRYILENSAHSEIYKKYNYQHLHSSYMELIASSGITGLALLGYLYIYVFYISWKKAPNDIKIFSICLYSFLIVINIFESYLFVKSGVLINTLVLGVLYSYNFKGAIENGTK